MMSVGRIPCVLMSQVPVLSLVWILSLSQPATLLQSEKNSLSLSQSCCEGQRVSLIFSFPICSHFFSCTLESLIISALVSLSSHSSQIALRKYLTEFCYHNRKISLENLFSFTFLCVLFFRLVIVVDFQDRVLLAFQADFDLWFFCYSL